MMPVIRFLTKAGYSDANHSVLILFHLCAQCFISFSMPFVEVDSMVFVVALVCFNQNG